MPLPTAARCPFPVLPQETCGEKDEKLVATTPVCCTVCRRLGGARKTIRIANQGDALSMDRIRSMNRCN